MSDWERMLDEARACAEHEPALSKFYYDNVLAHDSLCVALAHYLSEKLHSKVISKLTLNEVFLDCNITAGAIYDAVWADLNAYVDRDPACTNFITPFLYYKGFLALQVYRYANKLWRQNRKPLARLLQHRVSQLFDVDIHPAANIGKGIMLDHATGIVIGETAVVGDNVSLLHGVTLGGVGTDGNKRHPTVGSGVMMSCGAKVLGDITIGDNVKIGGGSLVLDSVPSNSTVVGVPGRVVGRSVTDVPAISMDQNI